MSLALLVEGLSSRDQASIVVYAGASGLVLPSTKGTNCELIPTGIKANARSVDTLRYQKPRKLTIKAQNQEMLQIKLRYKMPHTLMKYIVKDHEKTFEQAPRDLRFAIAVAGFGMLLRNSPHKGNASYTSIHKIAQKSLGQDPHGHRKELLILLKRAQYISKK